MNRRRLIGSVLAGSLVISGVSLVGCAVEPEGGYYGTPVEAGYYDEGDPYYWNGGYAGDYWVWHDHAGHEHREARAFHEQHARSFHGGEGARSAAGHMEAGHGGHGGEGARSAGGHTEAGHGGHGGGEGERH